MEVLQLLKERRGAGCFIGDVVRALSLSRMNDGPFSLSTDASPDVRPRDPGGESTSAVGAEMWKREVAKGAASTVSEADMAVVNISRTARPMAACARPK